MWAQANTRESIFEAVQRKETFATSGPRMKVRFFAGYDFDARSLQNPDWLKSAYQSGVAMGSDLSKDGKSRPPVFLIMAAKEPDGANLDRIQVVKGWVQNGKPMEKIYNVAWSGKRQMDKSGKLPPVGNTVDAKSARYNNSIGEAQLQVAWTDPDFQAAQAAIYYARVLEIPTPRWSTYDAVTLGIPPRKDVPASIQERAWTSPIWYTP